jgi:ATP-dependent Clp protease protease subunit
MMNLIQTNQPAHNLLPTNLQPKLQNKLPTRSLQLFNASLLARQYRHISNAAEATIWLYDIVGEDLWGGVSAKTFANDLAQITAPVIHLRINSPGGDVFDARAMVTALRQHPSRIIAHVDGLAASAASYIAMACDEIEMAQGAFLMIHNAWGVVVGNRHNLLEMAVTLEKVDASILADYQSRSQQSAEVIQDWMDAETWFTAAEALEAGFVDRVFSSPGGDEQSKSESPPNGSTEEEASNPELEASRQRRVALIERL